MDDGRHFTDYRPNCHLENLVRENNNTLNSFQYRMFLTHNAEHLMDLNRKFACELNCCGPCNNQATTSQSCISGETWGLASDSCPQFGNNMSNTNPPNCCSNRQNSANYYPNRNLGENVVVSRVAMPSGGLMMSGGDPRVAGYQQDS
jgi:hypothetical protein